MKILHCCLAAFYVDNYGYQENILPKMHKLQGHNVKILASTETYTNNKNLGYIKPCSYINNDGIPVIRIPYRTFLPHFIMKKLRIYSGVINAINSFNPDIIFFHDCQFVSIVSIAAYLKNNPIKKVYIDGHTDHINSATNWISKNILHKLIYRWCVKKIEPYTDKFYGVLPIRVEFFKKMYNVPSKKLEFLPLGFDDSSFDFSRCNSIRSSTRKRLDIEEKDFVIVTGGKIDERKNIHNLISAIRNIDCDNIKLILFGTPNKKMSPKIDFLSNHRCIRNIGWVSPDEINNYFVASDIGFFPGTHSVLWEKATGIGLPCVFKKWNGIQHVDLDGNCLFLRNGDIDEIQTVILKIYHDRELLSTMRTVAVNKGIPYFSYYKIAKKSIEFC